MNHWNGAGRHWHTPDLGAQVLIAYALYVAESERDRGPQRLTPANDLTWLQRWLG